MKKLFYFLLVILCQSSLFPQSFDWQWQNTQPTGNDLCDVVALSATRVLAFGSASTQLTSTDAGDNWQLNYIDASRNDIWGAYFLDQDNGYVCGGGGLIMKTTDGGISWTKQVSNTTAVLYDIEFLDINNGIAVGSTGVLTKTTDGGTTWISGTVGSITPTCYHVTVVNSSIVLVGTGSATPGRFLKSTDFGATFTSIVPTGISANVLGIYDMSATKYYVTSATGAVSVTTNGGTSWTLQTTPGVWVSDIKFIDDNLGFVADQRGNVWKTTNGGTNWTSTRLISRVTTGGSFLLKSSSYNSGNLFVVGLTGGIYKSTDDGATWSTKHTTGTQEILRKIAFTSSTDGFAFGGATSAAEQIGVIIKTTNGGQNWSIHNSSILGQVNSVAMPSANTWFIGCNNSKYYKTTDAGVNFTPITTNPIITTSFATAFLDEMTGYAGGLSGKVSKTTDGGTSWTDISTAAGFGSSIVYEVVIIDANNLFICGAGSRVAKSTDAGTTFTTTTTGLTGTIFFSMKFRNANEGFVSGAGLFKTTNGGSSWTSVTLPAALTGVTITNMYVGSGTEIWICSQNGDIVYSGDNGATWNYPSKACNTTLNSIAVSGSNVWVAGNGGVLLHSSESALPVELSSFTAKCIDKAALLKWTTQTEVNNHGFEVQRYDVNSKAAAWNKVGFVPASGNSNSIKEYSYRDNALSGKYLYRLKQIDNDGTFTYSEKAEVTLNPQDISLEQNYPNPFNPSTIIRYSTPEAGIVKLTIYNSLGEEIAQLVNSFMDAGSYEARFDASGLSSGVYFYKLEAGNSILRNKMMYVK